jgi:hypothetical protein
MQDEEMPDEVREAMAAYEKEYSKIRDKVIANNEKYKGTIYEDCPPLLDEQLRFFVRVADSEKEKERLKEKYGKCPTEWAIRVTWYKKQKIK